MKYSSSTLFLQLIAATLILSLLLALIALPIVLWQRHILSRRWAELANRLGLTYTPQPFNQMVVAGPALNKFARFLFQRQPQLEGIYGDRSVVIGVAFADMVNEMPVYRERLDPRIDDRDRPPRKHTTLRAAIRTQLPDQVQCICTKPGPLLAKTSGDLLTVARRSGLPAIESGDRPLSRHFRIHSQSENFVQRLFHPTVHQPLLQWRPQKPRTEFGSRSYGIEIRNGWLLYEEHRPSQFFTERGIPETLALVLQLAEALESVVGHGG